MRKNIMSLFIVFALLLSVLVTPVVAAKQPKTVQINGKIFTITQSEKHGKKTVTVSDGNETSTVTYDVKAKNAEIHTKNKRGRTILQTTQNFSTSLPVTQPIQIENPLETEMPKLSATSDPGYIAYSGSDGWWHYECAVRKFNFSPTKWWLKTNYAQKIVYENSSNISNLQNFMSSLNNMSKDEAACIAAGWTTLISAIVAYLTAPTAPATLGLPTIIAIVVALGGSVTCGYYAFCAWSDMKTATYYYSMCR